MHQDQQETAFAPDATPDVSIRTATSNDIEDLLALVRVCIDHLRSCGIEQWDEVYPDHNTIERDVRSGTTFLASNARETVGTIVLNDHQEPEYAEVPWQFTTGRVSVIHRLMIRPSMEGKGLGRLLMHFAEARALTTGCRSIRLDAFTENPRALRLYERLGYRDAGQVRFRKGYFRCFEKELGGAG
ncbi:MAG: GNAT family N-acetyltransferase [Acidobacteria bacterium]|nr:MAG: GNAT family N-acetyltransferase [Acidobacteriota bacterium]